MELSGTIFVRGASYFEPGMGVVECEGCGRYTNPVILKFEDLGAHDVACTHCGMEGIVFDSSTLIKL